VVRPAIRGEAATRFFLTLPLVAALLLPRFAISLAHRELSVPVLVIVCSFVGLAAIGRLRVHMPRLIMFAISIAAMITATMVGGTGRVSASSFLLLAVLYLGYVFIVAGDEATYASVISAFRRLCFVIAIVGIAQFFAQAIIRGPTLFTFRGVIPDNFLILGYNYVDPSGFIPGFFKSNGFFLPEPSIFGQVMALALITEILFFRPSYRLLIIGIALFLAFSGTGAILCLIFVPLLLLKQGKPSLLLLAAVLAVVLLMFSDSPYLAPYLGRFGEFGSGATTSSGFARFIGPFYLIDEYIFADVRNLLFGLGPGSIEAVFGNFYVGVFDPTWAKLFFEYGFVGTLPFALFVACSVFADAPTKWLAAVLFLNWLVMGGYLLSAPVACLMLPLTIWHRANQMRPVPGVSRPVRSAARYGGPA
jgi:hypothetical protein